MFRILFRPSPRYETTIAKSRGRVFRAFLGRLTEEGVCFIIIAPEPSSNIQLMAQVYSTSSFETSSNDLAEKMPDKRKALEKRLEGWLKETGAKIRRGNELGNSFLEFRN